MLERTIAALRTPDSDLLREVRKARGIAGYTEAEDLDYEAALSVVFGILDNALSAAQKGGA
jgi:hypothetical protein